MKVILTVTILFTFGAVILAIENDPNDFMKIDLDFFHEYLNLDKLLKRYVNQGVKRMLPFALQVTEHVNISSKCQDNLFQLMNGIRKLTEWSVYYLDSIGKPQSGMLVGNMQMYGEHKECFDAVVKKKDKTEFRGQYCGVSVKPIMPYVEKLYIHYKFEEILRLTQNSSGLVKIIINRLAAIGVLNPKIGICVPSGCTKDEISSLVKYLSDQIHYINATVLYCVKEEDLYYWTSERVTVTCIFAVLVMIVLIGCILDHLVKEKENNMLAIRILQCFSISRNFPKLMNTDSSEGTITCFYGIRVLSLFWIVLCHEYVMQGSALVANHSLDLLTFLKGFFSQIVLNGFTATEIFFFLGGFVNCYTRAKLEQNGKPQPSCLKLIIHRLWRIYPTYIITFFVLVLLSSTGPQLYLEQQRIHEICRKDWWKNILFINNYFDSYATCLPHSWYIAVDMQMFLISLITVPVLLRNEKIGIYLHSGIIVFGNITCFTMWWIRNLPPSPVSMKYISKNNVDEVLQTYFHPLLHIASYFIGIVFGYLLATKKEKKFSKVTLLLGWLIASFSYLFVLFFTYRFNTGVDIAKLESSLYGALSKSVLVLAVAWMVYCCKVGQGGVVNYILSLKLWIPLSRLTYMLYMIHIVVQAFYNYNLNFPTDFASMYLIWSYFGNLGISLLLSFALVLVVESPLLSMEKILFTRDRKEKTSPTELQKDVTANGMKEFVSNENPNINTVDV